MLVQEQEQEEEQEQEHTTQSSHFPSTPLSGVPPTYTTAGETASRELSRLRRLQNMVHASEETEQEEKVHLRTRTQRSQLSRLFLK